MNPNLAKDLTRQPPRSPRERLGGFVIFGRTVDKCRADLEGRIGEYHYDCPLDNILFAFKGINGEQLRQVVERGASDDELAAWINGHGNEKTSEEISDWDEQMERYSMYEDPEKRDFFVEECQKLGLDPAKTTLFEWLEADDRASFKQGS